MRHTMFWDKQEKFPLLFPRSILFSPGPGKPSVEVDLRSERRHLTIGDYTLAGYEDMVVCERKARLMELIANFFGDKRETFTRQYMKLASVTFPILFLDMTWSELLPRKPIQVPRKGGTVTLTTPHTAVDELFRRILAYGLFIVGPMTSRGVKNQTASRYRAGEFIARLMLARIYAGKTGVHYRLDKPEVAWYPSRTRPAVCIRKPSARST